MAIESKFNIRINTTADTSGAEKVILSHKEMHQGLHLLKDAFGEALGPIGEMGRFLGNPYVMAAAGATLAIKMLVEQHEKLREQIQKGIDISRDLSEQLRNAHTASLVAASEATATFAREQLHAHDNIDMVQKDLDVLIEKQKLLAIATEQSGADTEKLTESMIAAAKAAGLITPQQADVATLSAKRSAEIQKQIEEDAATQRAIDAKNAAAAKEVAAKQEAEGQIPGLNAQQSAMVGSLDYAEHDLDWRKKQAAELGTAAGLAQAKFSAHGARDEAADEAAYQRHRQLMSMGNFAMSGHQLEDEMNSWQRQQFGDYYNDKRAAEIARKASEGADSRLDIAKTHLQDLKNESEAIKANIDSLKRRVEASDKLAIQYSEEARAMWEARQLTLQRNATHNQSVRAQDYVEGHLNNPQFQRDVQEQTFWANTGRQSFDLGALRGQVGEIAAEFRAGYNVSEAWREYHNEIMGALKNALLQRQSDKQMLEELRREIEGIKVNTASAQ